jgi:hypothetical protein
VAEKATVRANAGSFSSERQTSALVEPPIEDMVGNAILQYFD